MNYVLKIFLLAASLTFALLTLSWFISGIRQRKIHYEANSPPALFGSQPVRFIALCVLYLALGLMFLTVAYRACVYLLHPE
jgi:hypothetical protein